MKSYDNFLTESTATLSDQPPDQELELRLAEYQVEILYVAEYFANPHDPELLSLSAAILKNSSLIVEILAICCLWEQQLSNGSSHLTIPTISPPKLPTNGHHPTAHEPQKKLASLLETHTNSLESTLVHTVLQHKEARNFLLSQRLLREAFKDWLPKYDQCQQKYSPSSESQTYL